MSILSKRSRLLGRIGHIYRLPRGRIGHIYKIREVGRIGREGEAEDKSGRTRGSNERPR